MTGVIGYARTMLHGGRFAPSRMPTFGEEVTRFHATLAALVADFADETLTARINDEQFLQGPLADAMTHAGQLAMLRRLHGLPVPSGNFISRNVPADNLTGDKPLLWALAIAWNPEDQRHRPGPRGGSPSGVRR